jgi:hypothetical protein
MEIVMGDVSSVLVERRSATKSGKVVGRIGMDVFTISAGLEVTSVLLFGRHLYKYEESTIMIGRENEEDEVRISRPFSYLIGSGRSIFAPRGRYLNLEATLAPSPFPESRTAVRGSAEAIIKSSLHFLPYYQRSQGVEGQRAEEEKRSFYQIGNSSGFRHVFRGLHSKAASLSLLKRVERRGAFVAAIRLCLALCTRVRGLKRCRSASVHSQAFDNL